MDIAFFESLVKLAMNKPFKFFGWHFVLSVAGFGFWRWIEYLTS